MGFFDMEEFRDPQVVEAEKQARKQNSMLQRVVNSSLDIGHQMLQANEMSLRMMMESAMNDEKKNKAEELRDLRSTMYEGTAKDDAHTDEIEEKAAKVAQSLSRTAHMKQKGPDLDFY